MWRCSANHRRFLSLALAVWGVGLLALAAGAQEGDGSTEALEWALIEAETALAHGEPQSADSHYRSALLEGWFLLGMLEVAADDLPAARSALLQATRAAATDAPRAQASLALVQMRLGEVAEAVNALRLLARQEPGDAATRRRLVEALSLAGQNDEAGRELEELRILDPGMAEALAGALADGDEEQPLEAASLAIDVGPLAGLANPDRAELRRQVAATLARIYRNLGVMHARAGRPDRARAAFAEAVATGGGPPAMGVALGRAELLLGGPQRRVKPQHLDPAALREAAPEALLPVIRQIDDGRLEAAESALRRILAGGDEPAPPEPETRDLLAVVLSHQERYEEAEAEIAAAIAAAPKLLPARQHLARIYLLNDREDEAAEQLRYAAELGPLERDLALELAAIERAAGRRAAANRQLRSVSRRFESPRAYLRLSEIAADLGNRKQALDYSRRAVGLAPSSEEALALHARNALAARIPSTAARAVEPLAKMHPDVAEYQYLLGRVWIELGNPEDAREALERALAAEPEMAKAHYQLSLACARLGDRDCAERHLELFQEAQSGPAEELVRPVSPPGSNEGQG